LDRDVPENLEKTLRALRPQSAAEKAKAVVKTAENLVGSFLDIAKARSAELLSTALPGQTKRAQFAFRNKKELSAADKDLLNSEQEDVDSSDES
jgi:gas vesicle protein